MQVPHVLAWVDGGDQESHWGGRCEGSPGSQLRRCRSVSMAMEFLFNNAMKDLGFSHETDKLPVF